MFSAFLSAPNTPIQHMGCLPKNKFFDFDRRFHHQNTAARLSFQELINLKKLLWDKPRVDCEKTRVACRVKPVRLATRLTRQALFLRGHAMAKIKVGYWVYESLYIAETYIQIETASVIRSEFLGVRTE
jgi:hypothetical protein